MNIEQVLISDQIDENCIDLLNNYEINVVYKTNLSKSELIKEIPKFDALIVRSSTIVDKDVINAGKRLKVIGRAGVGVDNIDVDACTAKNIIVLNSPIGNVISACELTCASILNLSRNIIPANNSLKSGAWDRKSFVGNEVFGKTLAIIGLGRVGKEVANRMQAFGMKIIASDPYVTENEAKKLYIQLLKLDEIWEKADYITIHTPLISTTRDLINEQTLNQCKSNVKIINVARGGIINEPALLNALNGNKCAGVALDVFEEEPPTSDVTKQLIRHPKVIVTPHLGASTYEAQIKVGLDVAKQILALTHKFPEFLELSGVVNKQLLRD